MDSNSYPLCGELNEIRQWKNPSDFYNLMEFVRRIWWPDGDYGWSQYDDLYSISTGGWSGNEEIIDALQENNIFWAFAWQSSKRGGHYQFKIKQPIFHDTTVHKKIDNPS